MNRLVAHLTVATLAAHVMLGCCWHHEHCFAQVVDSNAAVVYSDCGNAAHRSAPQEHDGGAHSQGLGSCQGTACVFIGSGTLNPVPAPACAPQACFTPRLLDVSGDRRDNVGRQLSLLDGLLPPVRLHLAYQVLLI